MKRKYVKRKITCKDIIRKVALIAGLDSRSIHEGYFNRKGWSDLLLKLEQLNDRISHAIDESGNTNQ